MYIVRKLERALLWISCAVVLFLALWIAADVVGRFFNQAITGALEISQLLLAASIWTGLVYVTMTRGHISIDILVSRFSQRVQSYVEIVANFFGLAAFAVLFWGTVKLALATMQFGETTPILMIPIYPIWFLLPIGAFLGFVELVLQIVERCISIVKERKQA